MARVSGISWHVIRSSGLALHQASPNHGGNTKGTYGWHNASCPVFWSDLVQHDTILPSLTSTIPSPTRMRASTDPNPGSLRNLTHTPWSSPACYLITPGRLTDTLLTTAFVGSLLWKSRSIFAVDISSPYCGICLGGRRKYASLVCVVIPCVARRKASWRSDGRVHVRRPDLVFSGGCAVSC